MTGERGKIGWAAISDPSLGAISNTSSYVPGFDLVVNTSGGFYNGSGNAGYISSFSGISNINFQTDRYKEFSLLRELGHLLQVPGFAGNDASDDAQRKNNDQLWQHCSKTITSFNN